MYKRSEIMTLIDTRNTVPEGVETHPQQTPQSANSQQVVSDVSEILNFFCLAGSMQLLQASVFPQRILQGSSKALLTSLSVWRCTKSLSILEGFQEPVRRTGESGDATSPMSAMSAMSAMSPGNVSTSLGKVQVDPGLPRPDRSICQIHGTVRRRHHTSPWRCNYTSPRRSLYAP